MKRKVLEGFGYFEPGPDEKTSGPYREFVDGQVLTEQHCTAQQGEDWEKKGHVGPDLDAAPPAAPAPALTAPTEEPPHGA